MMRNPIFCIAEEAKPFVRNFKKSEAGKLMHLVTARSRRDQSDRPTLELDDDEPFSTDFIGASKEDCQQWALKIGRSLDYINYITIVIAEARSADDNTVLIQQYAVDEEPPVYVLYGPQPAKPHKWYEWRVRSQDVFKAIASLDFGDISNVNQIYFGLRDELVNEHGIFDVTKAEDFVAGKDRTKIGSIVDWALVWPRL